VVPPSLKKIASVMVLPLRDLADTAQDELQRNLEDVLTEARIRIEPTSIRDLLSKSDFAPDFAGMLSKSLEWSEEYIQEN
jgi:hypothetical protein